MLAIGAQHPGPAPANAHVANFYDTDDELIDGASSFLGDGLRDGEAALVVATHLHRQALRRRLTMRGLDLDALEDDGLYVALDAATVMRSFMVDGTVDRELARQAVLPFLQAAAAKRRPMRSYGELVALVLQTGDLEDSLVLERMRNELASEFHVSLYCAYPSRLVQQVESLRALGELCAQHTACVAPSSYELHHSLGASPVSVSARSFLPLENAVGAARNYMVACMRGWEINEFLVGTAAASVAQFIGDVLSTRTRAFRIGLTAVASGVRVQVEYPSEADDGLPMNGIGLLERVSKDWGTTHNRHNRIMWAVFS